ncbi:MAG TPA: hypothetical protein VFJ61_04600 [Solirubrobacterales bacterium]|nr:hypothetical protein [Solirubrobacterales bacterium]
MALTLVATGCSGWNAASGPGTAPPTAPAATTPTTVATPPAGPGPGSVTRACAAPQDGGAFSSVTRLVARPSGVWAALPADDPGVSPVLVGTGDGGATWRAHCLGGPAVAESVFFADDAHGWAAVNQGAAGRLLFTSDGGATWAAGRLPDGGALVHDVSFLDARRGWAVGDGPDGAPVLLASVDGGRRWSAANAPAVTPPAMVRFVDPRHGWVADAGRHVASTVDGGATWTVSALTGEDSEFLRDMAFADRQHGWAVTAAADDGSGSAWATSDGGRTWTRAHRFPHGVADVAALGGGRVAVTGGLPVVVETSEDGGTAWSRRVLPAAFTDAGVLDQSTIWAFSATADRAGCLYGTGDGGRTWRAYAAGGPSCPPVDT